MSRRPFQISDVKRRAVAVVLLVAGTTALMGVTLSRAAISPKDRRLSDTRTGVTIEAPAGWTLSQHTGYADTIALLLYPDGSRISVTVAAATARDATALYEQNRPGLTAQHLALSGKGPGPRGSLAVDLDLGASGKPSRMRQLYFVREVPGGRQALVLTLVSRVDAFAARAPALDFVATRMGWDDPAAPTSPSSPRAGGGSSATGGSSAR